MLHHPLETQRYSSLCVSQYTNEGCNLSGKSPHITEQRFCLVCYSFKSYGHVLIDQ